MILVIRISGMVKIDEKIEETLYRLRLRRKYAAVLLKSSVETSKLLLKIRNHIAYGDIDEKTMLELIEKRGHSQKGKKLDPKKIIEQLEKKDLKDISEIKPFFRLHPPRGGIESKKHFGVGKGVLGDNKKNINDLVRRML